MCTQATRWYIACIARHPASFYFITAWFQAQHCGKKLPLSCYRAHPQHIEGGASPSLLLVLLSGTMPVFYALVARKSVVLAEYTGRSGNFPTVTRMLLGKITDGDQKMSYVYDK